ncbi:hypothetical protein ACN6QN_12985, partial [Acinetobacter baumannii]
MSHLKKQENFNFTYSRIFFICLAAYCYSSWLSLVLAKWLPFAKAENVYFSVFISFISVSYTHIRAHETHYTIWGG